MDDIILNKMSIIENCVLRIKEEYYGYEKDLFNNYTKQDSIILNIERASQACIDLGLHIIKIKKLGLPQTSREVFQILEENNIIEEKLSNHLKKMVGFKNLAVHNYQKIKMEIVENIIKEHLNDFIKFKNKIIGL